MILMMIVMMLSESDPSNRSKDVKLAKPVYFVTMIAATFIPTKRNLMGYGIWKNQFGVGPLQADNGALICVSNSEQRWSFPNKMKRAK